MANWSDLVDFEVHPVMTSKEAAEKIAPRLESLADTRRSPSEVLRGYILDVGRDPPLVAEGVLSRRFVPIRDKLSAHVVGIARLRLHFEIRAQRASMQKARAAKVRVQSASLRRASNQRSKGL